MFISIGVAKFYRFWFCNHLMVVKNEEVDTVILDVEDCWFLKKYAIPHRLDVGIALSFSPIKRSPPSIVIHISPHHLRLFVVLPNYFRYLLFASIS